MSKKIRQNLNISVLFFCRHFYLFRLVKILSASRIEIRSRKPTKTASIRNMTPRTIETVSTATNKVPINVNTAIASPNPVSTIKASCERILSASCPDEEHGWLALILKSMVSDWNNRSDIEKTLGSGSWICGSERDCPSVSKSRSKSKTVFKRQSKNFTTNFFLLVI